MGTGSGRQRCKHISWRAGNELMFPRTPYCLPSCTLATTVHNEGRPKGVVPGLSQVSVLVARYFVTPSDLLSKLRSLSSYNALLDVLTGLGFAYADEPRSTSGWPPAIREAVQRLRVAATHGQFSVLYVEVPTQQMLTWERQVVGRVLASDPHSLFVFTEPSHRLWHFVHVRYDEQLDRRRQLRRFVVDLGDPRGASRLRTTAERIAKLAVAPGQTLSVLELQARCDEAFRISEVSKGFLASFRKVVTDLTEALRQSNPTLLTKDEDALRQAQLLMDRLVFLYFVQKKGWLNGEQDYLYSRYRRRYQEGPQADTFYREHLLPLFRALSHRNAPRPHLQDGQEEALPFLNGGLFDLPLAHGTADPPMDERIRLPNEALYEVFENFLERYNFTTTEDSPLDVEVAINPEVIGTIFETFVLTSENEPETNAPDRRKATGSYYTPRVVVHFICRAVLRRYLAEQTGVADEIIKRLIEFTPAEQLTDELEAELAHLVTPDHANALVQAALRLRACDPAVGSGAFLVGLLQELVKIVTLLDLRRNGRAYVSERNYAYALKKRLIETSLYGVDIQEEAIQICELRLWLSLVVDYQVDEGLSLHERIRRIDPLPNLTFRVRVGDSLLDQIFGKDWELAQARYTDLVGELRSRKNSYYEAQQPEAKRDLERQILDLQFQLLQRRLDEQRLVMGKSLPMFSGLVTAKQRKEMEAIKAQVAEIDELLARCRQARQLAAQPAQDAWEHTRRFDAIRELVGVSFVWALDFAEVFSPQEGASGVAPGFDIVVGNPPFVTARNPKMRERYRRRWPTSCYKKYHMLAPFTELALAKLLRPQGQFGYIVSNAFATRDFGKPLVEQVFQRMELLNVVDCSGLMFPGHGTPTCVLLGHALTPAQKPVLPTLLCGTNLGKGQLHDEPEETALWREIETGWEAAGFTGMRVSCAAQELRVARKHPWSLNTGGMSVKQALEDGRVLRQYLVDDVGVATMTNSDEVFNHPPELFRRAGVEPAALRWFLEGDQIREWSCCVLNAVAAPYDEVAELLPIDEVEQHLRKWLHRFSNHLAQRTSFQSKTFEQLGRSWWEFERWHRGKYAHRPWLGLGEIASHLHVVELGTSLAIKQTVQVISLDRSKMPLACATALLNSSSALFWLKQVCYNKGAGGDEERDRFVYAGGKVQQLPVPQPLLEGTALRRWADTFAGRCAEMGEHVPRFHPRKLFEQPGEAYTAWYRAIRGYQEPHAGLELDWETADDLKTAWELAQEEMRRLRRQMVALQEEMDWLIYAAYGFLALDDPAVNLNGRADPMPVDQLDRPYRLIQHDRQVPAEWPASQKALWEVRLQTIAENDAVGQIEQPAYKRRWVEPFGARDFLQAYEWWLLEHRHSGGPLSLEEWAAELLDDQRVQAAYRTALEVGVAAAQAPYPRERDRDDFAQHLKRVVEEETVPDKRSAFRKKHEKLRGIAPEKHLPNGVPRERFRSVTERPGNYVWAGKDIWSGVEGDAWDA